MAGDRALRLKAGFALAKALGDRDMRKLFEQHGYRSGDEVVTALESDLIQDVFARLRRYSPPVVVAIYWPDTGALKFTSFSPSQEVASEDQKEEVGGTSTIGMLYRHAEAQQNPRFVFKMNWANPQVDIQTFALSGAC
ncbi:hypothetical protein ACFV1L_21135 [Kitasatospora sp. NPDC059646]|uniref:hypothetical protein n=1 Tax=Kitasatospora sp. NPDC059646 TaxID=3346893 RepID=UPI0036C832E0